MKNILIIIHAITFAMFSGANPGSAGIPLEMAQNAQLHSDLAIATYVSDEDQEKKATVLVKSLRHNGGEYKNCPVYVVVSDSDQFPCTSIRTLDVNYLQVKTDPSVMDYPFAYKAFAAARVEELVKDQVKTLAWFDPETIILGSLKDLDLKQNKAVALRPVYLNNTIGLEEKDEVNDYWRPVLQTYNLDLKKLPMVTTVVDQKKIRAYYNCGIFSVNPSLGIFTEWARHLSDRLKDPDYQKNACHTPLRKIFLHQITLTAVLLSKIKQDQIQWLPMTCGYSILLHDRMPKENKLELLNKVSCAIVENVWEQNPNWMNMFQINEPLKSWLSDTYIDFIKVTENIYRLESTSNSYLVTTKAGSVLIDPSGATSGAHWYRTLMKKHPLKAILLTHGHLDHRENIKLWTADNGIPVIAQRKYPELLQYHDRLATFFYHRNTIWQRSVSKNDTLVEQNTPVVPTVFFADTLTYELGGLRFVMKHTPGETPDQATIWIPELSAVFVGDNYYEYFINNATFRGTTLRPLHGYIDALNYALELKPDYFLMGHGKPVVTRKHIDETIGNFRNMLQYIYDETVKGINQGKDVYTLMKEIQLPSNYKIAPYFGKVEWTVRGLYHELIGWFDENPATMYSEPFSSVYPFLMPSGSQKDSLISSVQVLLDQKEYVKALHLTDFLLSVQNNEKTVHELRLKALKSMRKISRNYIENIWLDYGIKQSEGIIRTP